MGSEMCIRDRAAFVPRGSASRSRAGCGAWRVSRGREARAISFMPAGVEGGLGAVVVVVRVFLLRFGVEGGGSDGSSPSSSSAVVVVVVVLRFLEFLGGAFAAGGRTGLSFFDKRLLAAALRRLDRRVAIVRSEWLVVVMR